MDSYYENLAQSSNTQNIKKLLIEYISSKDNNTQITIRKALYFVEDRKVLITTIHDVVNSLSDLQERFVLLKLSLKISRPTFLYEYLSCSYELGVKPKGTGLFEKTNKPLSEYEKKEIVRHIIDNNDYRPMIVNLAGENNLITIQENAYQSILAGTINKDIIKCVSTNQILIDKCQKIIKEQILTDSNNQVTLGKYLDINIPDNQILILSFTPTAVVWDSVTHNIWLTEHTDIIDSNFKIFIKLNNKERLNNDELDYIKKRISEDLNNMIDINSPAGNKIFMFLRWISYIEEGYQEKILIKLYEKTEMYSHRALEELIRIQSEYAYRVMLNSIMTTLDSGVRIRYALSIAKNYKHHIGTLYNYAKGLDNQDFIQVLKDKGFVPPSDFLSNKPILEFSDINKISILDNNTVISDILYSIAEEIDATSFICAVGFTYKSGLRMILPVIDYVYNKGGKTELIIGALQDYCIGNKTTRIDYNSVEFLQYLIDKLNLVVYGYPNTFYHGKFYYISNEKKAYVIIGSSNISKTAYLNNYELDLLIEFDVDSETNRAFNSWYSEFRNSSQRFDTIDSSLFYDLNLIRNQDNVIMVNAKREHISHIKDRISKISDENTRKRLDLWMKYKPTEIYSQIGIKTLEDYIVFLYPEKELAVFDSYKPGKDYYTFRYTDFEELLVKLSNITKMEMLTTSDYLRKSLDVKEDDQPEDIIKRFFI